MNSLKEQHWGKALVLLLAAAACSPENGERTETGQTAAAMPDSTTNPAAAPAAPNQQMQAVLTELAALEPKPIPQLSAAEARKQPTPSDAVKALLTKQGKSTAPYPAGNVVNRTIPGAGGPIPIRIHTPKGSGPFPVVVYYHGGAWVIADPDTYDASPTCADQSRQRHRRFGALSAGPAAQVSRGASGRLLVHADLKGMPGATVITAQIDPLRSEGKELADRLKDAGAEVDYQNYEGVTHEFFGMGAMVDEAKQAQQQAADGLKKGFGGQTNAMSRRSLKARRSRRTRRSYVQKDWRRAGSKGIEKSMITSMTDKESANEHEVT